MATAPAPETDDAPRPEKQKHLYLVDGSGFIFRAYHRLPPLSNPKGVNVGAVYGFTAMLWKLIEDLNGADEPTHLAVIFDAGKITFRNDMYDQYKANRPEPPDDLLPQFPLIRDAVRAFSVPCMEIPGYEADDLIAAYVREACANGYHVTIVSSDKDLMQLVSPCVDMLDTMKNERIARAEVIAKFGVPPEQVGEVLALMGDSVDNVPGVRGIGPKTAAELIQAYGDVEGVLANAHEIKKPKLRESLIEQADMARLSRKLVELCHDCPLPEPIETLTLQEPPHEPLRAFLAEHGFKSLLNKLGSQPEPEPEPQDIPFRQYETVITEDRLDWWVSEAIRLGRVAFDTETNHIDATRARLVGISLALEAGKACYIPVDHRNGEGLLAEPVDQLPRELVLAKLKPLLEDPSVLKVAQNLKYDLMVMKRSGVGIAGYDDTMLMSYALSAGRGNHGMDELSVRHLMHTPLSFKDVCGTGKAQCTFDTIPLDRATEYSGEDADVTIRLHDRFKPRLAAEGVTRVYETVDKPIVPVVADMELAGIRGRPGGARRAVEGLWRGDRAHRGRDLRTRGRPVHHRQPQAAGRDPVRKAGAPRRQEERQVGAVRHRRHHPGKAGARRPRDRAADSRLAAEHQAQVDLHRRAAAADPPRNRPRPYLLLAGGGADRAAVVDRPEPPEHPDPHRAR